jgi:hypothetical protein
MGGAAAADRGDSDPEGGTMAGQQWTVEAVTERIEAIDPGGPVLEAGAALRRLHQQLVDDLGTREALDRFDRALEVALRRRRLSAA